MCLICQDVHGGSMPAYFRFLTILAFHIFLQEKVSIFTELYHFITTVEPVMKPIYQINSFDSDLLLVDILSSMSKFHYFVSEIIVLYYKCWLLIFT